MSDASGQSETVPQLDLPGLFRLGDQFHDSALLHFATDVKLFDFTAEPRSVDAVAALYTWLPRKTRIFLDALTALGLLKRKAGLYENCDAVNAALVSNALDYIGAVILHQYRQWSIWPRIGEVLAAQASLPFQQEIRLRQDLDANAIFNLAMVRLSKLLLDGLLSLPQFRGRKRVLDLAGGHGTYLAVLARANPQLSGEVWDLENTRTAANRTFAEFGVADRILFRERDITRAAAYAGEAADIVMLNDCLHYFTEDTVRQIISAATTALLPEGSLIVLSMRLDDDRITPAPSACFSFHMMLNTRDGGLHTTGFLRELLVASGLDVETSQLGRYGLLVGTRPSPL
jgi:SAM-dependent methyltransferase